LQNKKGEISDGCISVFCCQFTNVDTHTQEEAATKGTIKRLPFIGGISRKLSLSSGRIMLFLSFLFEK
jgi:hypothetical protein